MSDLPHQAPQAAATPTAHETPAGSDTFDLFDFQIALGSFLGSAVAERLGGRFAELVPNAGAWLTTSQAADLILDVIAPEGWPAAPLPVAAVEVAVDDDEHHWLTPERAAELPVLSRYVLPTVSAFVASALGSATPRASTPIKGVTLMTVDRDSPYAVVELVLAQSPHLVARIHYGEMRQGGVTRAVDLDGEVLVAIGVVARSLSVPLDADDPIRQFQVVAASIEAPGAVLH